MITIADLDPVFLAAVRTDAPALWPNHLRLVRLAHETDADELEAIDAELEVLAARRRAVLDRLAHLRPRLWPESHRRHVRRRCRVDERALPPPVVGAEELGGVELRRAMVGVVRRHGAVSLRELHGLLHRYGYAIGGGRPVQRLADAAAYETRAGRLRRVARGVYAPGPEAGMVEAGREHEAEPLAWDRPEPDMPPPIDPAVADDPDRWSDQTWPAEAQVGSTFLPPPVDPAHRSLGEDLTACVSATRTRLAALIAARRSHPTSPRTSRPVPWIDPVGDDSSTNRSPRNDAADERSGGDGEPGVDGAP